MDSVRATPFHLALTFSDGLSGIVDMASSLENASGVFLALRDPNFFARVCVDRESGTVVWPNDVDLDPYVLYQAARDGIALEEAMVQLSEPSTSPQGDSR